MPEMISLLINTCMLMRLILHMDCFLIVFNNGLGILDKKGAIKTIANVMHEITEKQSK